MILRDYNIKNGLYIVGTPIGNLGDISARALAVLERADRIICEDTRETAKLLSAYEISKPFIVFNSHGKAGALGKIIELLDKGETLALVSDAGTPAISDPGSFLVDAVREHFEKMGEEAPVFAVPGPSAVVSALSVSGFPSSEFVFYGFLPHKKGREKLFDEIADSPMTAVFYESPHRIMKALESLRGRLKDERQIAVCRELTKVHEETVRGFAEEVYSHYLSRPDKVRGEFAVVVGPAKAGDIIFQGEFFDEQRNQSSLRGRQVS